jgi:hypothetical protein
VDDVQLIVEKAPDPHFGLVQADPALLAILDNYGLSECVPPSDRFDTLQEAIDAFRQDTASGHPAPT